MCKKGELACIIVVAITWANCWRKVETFFRDAIRVARRARGDGRPTARGSGRRAVTKGAFDIASRWLILTDDARLADFLPVYVLKAVTRLTDALDVSVGILQRKEAASALALGLRNRTGELRH
jgi:hypothetical protein